MTDLGMNLNCASKKEHVPGIERFILTFKERVRSARATMPLKRISKLMIVNIFASTIFWLNVFPPSTSGIIMSDRKGPRQLILGDTVDYKKVCRLQPGEYVQVHQEDEPQNMIAIDRTVGAIALGNQYNLQGGYFFDILLTGKLLRRSHWTLFNMPGDVIELYDTFNTKGCPEDLIFGDFNDQPIPSTYYELINNYDDNGIKMDDSLMEN